MECMVTTVLLSVSEGFLLLISCTTAIRSCFSVGLEYCADFKQEF